MWPAYVNRLRSAVHATPSRRGLASILAGTAGGQIVALIAAPVLSRLYLPDDFGLFTVFSSLVTTVGVVAAWRLELAIPLPKTEGDAYALVALGFLAACSTLVLGIATLAILSSVMGRLISNSNLGAWIWLVPPYASFLGCFLVLNQLAVRHRRFAAIGQRSLLQQGVIASGQLGCGLAGLRPGGLILGFGIGQLAGTASMLRGSGLSLRHFWRVPMRSPLRATLRRYWRFPVFFAPSGLLNVAGLTLPALLMAYYYGLDVAGWFGLTQRILAVPMALIGAAVGQVYVAELTRLVNRNRAQCWSLFRATSLKLAVIASVVTGGLLILGPLAFRVVFGTDWVVSGMYAQALALSLGCQLLSAPLSQTLVVFERPLLQLGLDSGRLMLVSAAIIVCQNVGSTALQAVWIYGIAAAASQLAGWLVSRKVVMRGSRSTDR